MLLRRSALCASHGRIGAAPCSVWLVGRVSKSSSHPSPSSPSSWVARGRFFLRITRAFPSGKGMLFLRITRAFLGCEGMLFSSHHSCIPGGARGCFFFASLVASWVERGCFFLCITRGFVGGEGMFGLPSLHQPYCAMRCGGWWCGFCTGSALPIEQTLMSVPESQP